jgi:hypothetical protein
MPCGPVLPAPASEPLLQRAGRPASGIFVGDQHVSPTPYYQNTPIFVRLLAEWGAAPAGCLFLLPLWH